MSGDVRGPRCASIGPATAKRAIAPIAVLLLGAVSAFSPAIASPSAPRWLPPLESVTVLAAFDPPAQDWLAGHRGVDLVATPGELVRAPADGTVAFVGVIADRAVVVINHGGVRSTYEPVTGSLAVGQTVTAGSVIGTLTEGGHCATRCLHWGAISGETYIDPLLLVRGYIPVLKTPW